MNNNDISVSVWFKWWKWIYQVFLNDDNEVTAFDIIASNGIIHVIDRVLKRTDTIIEVAKSEDDFSILVKSLTRVNLIDTLSSRNFQYHSPCLVKILRQHVFQSESLNQLPQLSHPSAFLLHSAQLSLD